MWIVGIVELVGISLKDVSKPNVITRVYHDKYHGCFDVYNTGFFIENRNVETETTQVFGISCLLNDYYNLIYHPNRINPKVAY